MMSCCDVIDTILFFFCVVVIVVVLSFSFFLGCFVKERASVKKSDSAMSGRAGKTVPVGAVPRSPSPAGRSTDIVHTPESLALSAERLWFLNSELAPRVASIRELLHTTLANLCVLRCLFSFFCLSLFLFFLCQDHVHNGCR